MNSCPNCQAETIDLDSGFCHKCGYDMAKRRDSAGGEPSNADDLEFVVTEATSDNRDFVGGQKKFPDAEDELGIESTSDLMEKKARGDYPSEQASEAVTQSLRLAPVGDSSPPLPPQAEHPAETAVTAEKTSPSVFQEFRNMSTAQIRKLTPEEVRKIEKNLYGETGDYLSDREKNDLVQKLGSIKEPFGNTPIEPPKRGKTSLVTNPDMEMKTDLPAPTMSKKGKGIALYYKSYIQLVGGQEILPNDELVISNRVYELKPKRFNKNVGVIAAAVAFGAVLLVVGSLLVRHGGSNQGEIIGMVLDENNQPLVQEATVRLPDLGQTFKTNVQGFFKTGAIPEGTHKLQYVVNGRTVKEDFATIAGGKVTLVTLRPDQAGPGELTAETPARPTDNATTVGSNTRNEAATAAPIAKPRPTDVKSARDEYAKITLQVDVEGARFELDGSILGAGNVTYSKIAPGRHSYIITRDGYAPVSGQIALQPGEIKTLKFSLSPAAQNAVADAEIPENHFQAGSIQLKKEQYQNAAEEFSRAIALRPGYVEAYFYRGEAYSKIRNKQAAHDDFVRAAEIYQIQKDYNWAVTCYNRAIEVDKASVTALLGRGQLFLRKGEQRAAITDFEEVLRYDKRNAQAYFGLGEARFQQANYKTAIDHFKDARSLDPKNPLVYQYLMLAYLAREDTKNVKKSFEKFKEVASETQYNDVVRDKKYAGVLEAVESK